jgi:hypothetical protein
MAIDISDADPHHLDADPDPACPWIRIRIMFVLGSVSGSCLCFDPYPDPACHYDADPDLRFHFDANPNPDPDPDPDPDPSFQIKVRNLGKVLK